MEQYWLWERERGESGEVGQGTREQEKVGLGREERKGDTGESDPPCPPPTHTLLKIFPTTENSVLSPYFFKVQAPPILVKDTPFSHDVAIK